MERYRNWDLYDTLPPGWRIDNTAGSPLHGYEFCTNGKSLFSGENKRALVRATLKTIPPDKKDYSPPKKEEKPPAVVDAKYVRTVNELAREKFKLKLLAELRTDLMICEIEGWSKLDYLNQLRRLIAGLGKSITIELRN